MDMADSDSPSSAVPLLGLPEDVLGLVSRYLRPVDICGLILCCRSLRSSLSSSDKVWLTQCERIGPPSHLLSRWRDAGRVPSYRSLCRFLLAVHPLLGIWVHQNPELGNVVCVVWGFLSVVGCRVIPQELGPHGLDASPLLWAPVFEIVAASDGSVAAFYLHGRERDATVDSLYPGSVKSVDPFCNVLLLEVDAFGGLDPLALSKEKMSKSLVSIAGGLPESRRICRSDTSIPRLPASSLSFSRLAFGDRRRLLELVARRVRIKVRADTDEVPLFPGSACTDMAQLSERRELLVQMHKLGRWQIERREVKSELDLVEHHRSSSGRYCDGGSVPGRRSLSFAGYFRDGLRQVFGKASSFNGSTVTSKNRRSPSPSSSSSSAGESKHLQLHEFLRNGDMVSLSLRASNVKLVTYKAWPNMHDNRFALYKLPLQVPIAGREFAGLWGGTFGWPPGHISEDKPAKALFFLLLSYEETEDHRLLIATKILEGTHYVLHPNGSAMFTVKVDEPSSDPFPWGEDGASLHMEVKHSYSGEGIANGYGFRYPSSKPGSLFVTQNGLLAFVWKETRAVLTLQRLDVEELLKKGERVPALPPIANFAYLTKSYSNVFAGFTNNYGLSSSQRFVL